MIIRCGTELVAERKSGCDEPRHPAADTLFGDHIVSFFQAGPALRGAAESSVDCFGIAIDLPGRAAQLAFPNGVADADVHTCLRFDTGKLMRMGINSKPWGYRLNGKRVK